MTISEIPRPPSLQRTWVSDSAAELPTLQTIGDLLPAQQNREQGAGPGRSRSKRLPYLSTAQISYASDTQRAVFESPFLCFPRSRSARPGNVHSSSDSNRPSPPGSPTTDFEELSAVLRLIPSTSRMFPASGVASSPSLVRRNSSSPSPLWQPFRSQAKSRSQSRSRAGSSSGHLSDTTLRRTQTSDPAPRRPSLAISITNRSHVSTIDLDPAWSSSDGLHTPSSQVTEPTPAIPAFQDGEHEGEEWLAYPDDDLIGRQGAETYVNRRSWGTFRRAMSTSSASSSIKGFPIDTGSHVPAAAGPSVGSPRRASTRMESWNSGTHDDWAGPPTANSDRLKRRRRSKATHEGSKSPSTFLAFFWDKDKDKTQPQRTVASAQVQPIFSDDIKGRLDSEGSKSQGPDRRGSMKPSHASEKCVQSMPAAYDVSPSAPRSIVSLSDRRNVMTARSVSSASSLASSSYQMSPQSSAGTSSSQCMSSIHSLNVDFNATSSFRANSVRSNSASAESHNDHRLSIVNSSQTKTGDSSRSSGSHSRTKGPNAGQIKKKSPGAAASTAIMDPSTKAMLSADQAFAAMFPYDESRTLRRQRQKADSISVAAEKLERGWNHAPQPHSSSFGGPDATGHQDYLTRIISPKTTVVPDAKAAQLKASTLRRPKTEDGSGGEGTRKQRGGFGTRFSAWLDKI